MRSASITTMQNDLYNSAERGEIVKIEKENVKLVKEKENLGTFKKKEKKAIQDKIDRNNYEIKLLEEKNRKNID